MTDGPEIGATFLEPIYCDEQRFTKFRYRKLII